MSERILVSVAWPYANGSIHIGQVAGAYLPADIFARYHRLKGNEVLMVSGSDAHGTPVTLTAEQRGVSPDQVSSEYQAEFLDNWERLGINFDLFTTTHTDNHAEVSQDIFLTLHKNGFIYKDTTSQPYCEADRRYLADRYVEGTCPHCGEAGARGDQCDSCGRTLDPQELIDIACRICGSKPVFRETEHFFLSLSAFEDRLLEWVREQRHWRPNVRNFTIGFLEGGLHDRAITRDIDWGVPVPLDGYEDKRIYVWFEAVIGYLSAAKEWAQRQGDPEAWRDWWEGDDARSVYFIGKDNVPFHTIIWPAMLTGYGDLNLPTDVPANQYLTFKGGKASASRGVGLTIGEGLRLFEPDALRYALAASFPEQSDTDISVEEIARRTNDELVATWGNLVNRVLSMVNAMCDAVVPEPGDRTDVDLALLAGVDAALVTAADQIDRVELRAALRTAMEAAAEVNAYLNVTEPWKLVRTDPDRARVVLGTALDAVNGVRVAFSPYLPFSSSVLEEVLGPVEGWRRSELSPGRPIDKPAPLFAKVDLEALESGEPG